MMGEQQRTGSLFYASAVLGQTEIDVPVTNQRCSLVIPFSNRDTWGLNVSALLP
jgi:hypothetical protein